jgi:peptide deformylase
VNGQKLTAISQKPVASSQRSQELSLTIVQAGDPALRQIARALTRDEILSAQIRNLIESMTQSMRDAPGVGLAAPQVGQSLQLAVIEDRPEYTRDWSQKQLAERERNPVEFHVIVNPKLTLIGDESAEFFEGCLSLAGLMALVPRKRQVRVECLDEQARPRVIEATGWYARILQHEIDHLFGNLYVDRMYSRSLMTVENYKQHWLQKTLPEIKAELKTENQNQKS